MTVGGEGVKVAVTGLRGIPGVMGGVETHCEELLPRVAGLSPEMEITVLGRAPYLLSKPSPLGSVKITSLPAPKRQSTEAIVSTLLGVLYARRRAFDIIHIHAVGPGLLAPLARFLQMRVVMTHHGADYDRAKWGLLARLSLRLGERWGVAAAHHVIAVSPSLAASLRSRFPAHASKISYIPNGAPMLGFTGEPREATLDRLGLEAGRFVLAVGRLVPEKGHDYLVDAFLASGSDQTLVIVGGSDHDGEYARRVLAREGERVRFLGVQPRSVLRHLYESASLFVLPSFHEGLPIVALEAARCDAPMLMSDIEPNRDIGLPAANYFPVGDVGALASALERPAGEFAVDGEAVRRRFDWDAIARETATVYRAVASRGDKERGAAWIRLGRRSSNQAPISPN